MKAVIQLKTHLMNVLGDMKGPASIFVVISLQNALKEDFVVMTNVTKSHPISSPAVVAVEYMNIAFSSAPFVLWYHAYTLRADCVIISNVNRTCAHV